MLRDIDTLVIDLQDIGTRIYTYVYTMANCMRAAQRARHPRHRLRSAEPDRRRGDRRHHARGGIGIVRRTVPGADAPRDDDRRAGPALQRALWHRRRPRGRRPWTAGARSMYWDDTGLPWVMPSPNIPTLDSAIAFPGTVHIEGTTASEGRGTTRPFELVGAPWVRAEALRGRAQRAQAAGSVFSRRGLRADVPEACESRSAEGARFTCWIDWRFGRSSPGWPSSTSCGRRIRRASRWKPPPYEYEHDREPIELIAGSPSFRAAIDRGDRAEQIESGWQETVAAFRDLRQPYLLYE